MNNIVDLKLLQILRFNYLTNVAKKAIVLYFLLVTVNVKQQMALEISLGIF